MKQGEMAKTCLQLWDYFFSNFMQDFLFDTDT